MTFHHHYSNSLERLQEALLSLAPPCSFDDDGFPEAIPDPFAKESFVTPTTGMQRWLTQQLSYARGVFANGDFYQIEKLMEELCDILIPVAGTQAWRSQSLLWPIAEVLREVVLSPEDALDASQKKLVLWLKRNNIQIQAGALPDQLMQLAYRIGESFHRYSLYRTELVLGWEAAEASSPSPEVDSAESSLEDTHSWQAALWRLLTKRIQAPHPGKRLLQVIQLLENPLTREHRLAINERIGARLVLFGLHTLAPIYVKTLVALSQHYDIHLFHLMAGLPFHTEDERPHPLRHSLGRLSDELDQLLELHAYNRITYPLWVAPPAGRQQPLLTRLQRDLFQPLGINDSEPILGSWSEEDLSLRFYACSSPLRQAEVLRDALLRLLAQDSSLQPRDILILTPDLETYAPLLDAVFRDGDSQDGNHAGFPTLHYRQNLTARRANPLAEAFLAILDLVGKRLTITEVLDLMELSAPLEKAELDEQEFAKVRDLLIQANIRWGVDAEHRQQHDQPGLAQNTWRSGFDRLLLGHAIASEGYHLWAGVTPLDAIEGKEVENLGSFIDYAENLFDELRDLHESRTIPEWQLRLTQLVNRLLIKDENTSSQAQPIFDEFDALVSSAAAGGFQGKLQFRAIHQLLLRPFEARRPTMNLLSGGMTFSTFKPMRAIPYKVIALLGMDAGTFPRSPLSNGFDLIDANHRVVGDRSARDEDRMAFLETIMSARQHLLMTWTGYRASDRRELDSAGPVSELMELIRRNLQSPDGRPYYKLPKPLLSHAPMQPFTPSNYRDSDTRSFDQRYLSGAKRSLKGGEPLPPHWSHALPLGELPNRLTLEELSKFLREPAKWFCNRRLLIGLEDYSLDMPDREPIELNALDTWKLKDALLRWELKDVPAIQRQQAMLATGALPFGAEGEAVLNQVEDAINKLADEARARGLYHPKRALIDLSLDGITLEGSIDGLCEGADGLRLIQVIPSSLKIKYLLPFWVSHLALCATLRSPVSSFLVCPDRVVEFFPILATEARERLYELCNLWSYAHREPIRFFPHTAWTLMQELRGPLPTKPLEGAIPQKAQEAWLKIDPYNADYNTSESLDPYVELLFGSHYQDESATTEHHSLVERPAAAFPFNQEAFFSIAATILNPLYHSLNLEVTGSK